MRNHLLLSFCALALGQLGAAVNADDQSLGHGDPANFEALQAKPLLDGISLGSDPSLYKRFDTFKRFEPYQKRFEPFNELKRFDPYSKRFDPYSKRFDGYNKRFDGYNKRFDGYNKRFDPYSKRFDGYMKRFEP
ncbi:unnamed protein product, partial [Mesorhabditis spiculigera]